MTYGDYPRYDDYQRSKVYRAEQLFRSQGDHGTRIPRDKMVCGSIEECQRFIDKVTSYQWFTSRWDLRGAVTVEFKNGTRTAYAKTWARIIRIPKDSLWANSKIVLLHELAHIMQGRGIEGSNAPEIQDPKYDARYEVHHGRGFVKRFLFLIDRVLGVDAGRDLRGYFKRYKVKARGTDKARSDSLSGKKAATTNKTDWSGTHVCRKCEALDKREVRLVMVISKDTGKCLKRSYICEECIAAYKAEGHKVHNQ